MKVDFSIRISYNFMIPIIPAFQYEQEESDFWDSHDSTKFHTSSEKVNIQFFDNRTRYESQTRQMQISSLDSSSFQLDIVNYQFPQEKNEYYDANWLRVKVTVNHPEGSWDAQDPCLLTFEVRRLAEWLEQVHSSTNLEPTCRFIEPCLKFEVVERKSLRIHFKLELRPNWAKLDIAGAQDLWVEFSLSEIDLEFAAHCLREQLKRFPQRVFHE